MSSGMLISWQTLLLGVLVPWFVLESASLTRPANAIESRLMLSCRGHWNCAPAEVLTTSSAHSMVGLGSGRVRRRQRQLSTLAGRGDLGDDYELRLGLFNQRLSTVRQINSQEGSWKALRVWNLESRRNTLLTIRMSALWHTSTDQMCHSVAGRDQRIRRLHAGGVCTGIASFYSMYRQAWAVVN